MVARIARDPWRQHTRAPPGHRRRDCTAIAHHHHLDIDFARRPLDLGLSIRAQTFGGRSPRREHSSNGLVVTVVLAVQLGRFIRFILEPEQRTNSESKGFCSAGSDAFFIIAIRRKIPPTHAPTISFCTGAVAHGTGLTCIAHI